MNKSEVDDILLFAESSAKLCKQNLEATNVTNKEFYLKYLANSLYATGFFYFNKSEYPKALEYHRRSLKIQEEINDKMGIAITLNDIGAVIERQDDIPKALEYYHKSLKIDEELKNKNGIAYTLNNIGSIFDNQGDIPKALEYYHKSLKIQEEIMDKMGIATSLNNIGFIYYNQGPP
ncbi:MAG: tetratricopeptide repeat protein [Bacteroidetes bacterium]|nr:tetratricopeptide repeat protein [Bacteroidota bacterium]